jgi:hypothetical protein
MAMDQMGDREQVQSAVASGVYFLEFDPAVYPYVYRDSACHMCVSFKLTYGQLRKKGSNTGEA